MNRIKSISKTFSTNSKVIFEYKNKNCKLILNNDKNLNALDTDMVQLIIAEINSWKQNKQFPENLIITSKPDSRSFCVGGDIKSIYEKIINKEPTSINDKFFKDEYQLDFALSQLLKKFGTTTFAFWNGFVMGGGVGITINSTYRIVNESTIFAMPETLIGLFPDVGTMYHLTKIQKGVAFAVAILGMRLKGVEVLISGLAEKFVLKENFENIQKDIFDMPEGLTIKEKDHMILNIFEKYSQKEFLITEKNKFDKKSEQFEKWLSDKNFDECVKNVQHLEKDFPEFRRNLALNSPFSMRLTFNYFEKAKNLKLKDIFEIDFRLVKHFLRDSEFKTGVKNLLIDKSKERANWKHNNIEDSANFDYEKWFSQLPENDNFGNLNIIE